MLCGIWLVFTRYFTLFIRNPAWVGIGLLQPILYLVLFAPLLSSIASVPGFPPGSFAPIVFTATLPLLLLSRVLLPLSLAPAWLRAIASANPLSYAVDAARAVFNNQLEDVSVVRGVLIMLVLAIASIAIAGRSFN